MKKQIEAGRDTKILMAFLHDDNIRHTYGDGAMEMIEKVFVFILCTPWLLICINQLNMARRTDRIEFAFSKYYKKRDPIMYRVAITANAITAPLLITMMIFAIFD